MKNDADQSVKGRLREQLDVLLRTKRLFDLRELIKSLLLFIGYRNYDSAVLSIDEALEI